MTRVHLVRHGRTASNLFLTRGPFEELDGGPRHAVQIQRRARGERFGPPPPLGARPKQSRGRGELPPRSFLALYRARVPNAKPTSSGRLQKLSGQRRPPTHGCATPAEG